ncbi:MAG TPA: flagellar hook-basal body complex protein FliE [Vicinamibacterales bacterium]|nr:flagellar hook-basal body complex protein FliE [Vicinamibacterales bacterium]
MAIDALARLGSLAPSTLSSKPAPAAGGIGKSFGESLMSLVESVESTGAEANTAVSNMLDKTGDVHDAMIALQRAEMSLQLTVQIRNKLVNAYQDIMRMPI